MHQKTHKNCKSSINRIITILSVPINNISFEKALDKIADFTKETKLHHIVTVNPEFLVIAHKNPTFKRVLQSADLRLADGVGLQFAALLQGKKFITRVQGSNLIYRLLPWAEKRKMKIFLLGAGPGVAEKTAQNLVAKYVELKVSFSGADPDKHGTREALTLINNFKPHILLVAYGAPTQDLWIYENRKKIKALVAIGVGGTLDFLAGKTKRAPEMVSKLGFEWLYRLILEPWRIKRQLRLPYFVLLIARKRLSFSHLLSNKKQPKGTYKRKN